MGPKQPFYTISLERLPWAFGYIAHFIYDLGERRAFTITDMKLSDGGAPSY